MNLSKLLVLLLVAGAISLPGRARAEVTQEARDALTSKHFQAMGQMYPLGGCSAIVETGGGAKMPCSRGVILWSPSTAAHVVAGDFWTRYRGLGAESGALGFPLTDAGKPGHRLQSFQLGALVRQGEALRVVRGMLHEVWKKNQTTRGPLGLPLEDSEIHTTTVSSGGVPFTIVTSATQEFEGATIRYTLGGLGNTPPGWRAEVNPGSAARVTVQAHSHLQIGFTICVKDDSLTQWVQLGEGPVELARLTSACQSQLWLDVWATVSLENGKLRAKELEAWALSSDVALEPDFDLADKTLLVNPGSKATLPVSQTVRSGSGESQRKVSLESVDLTYHPIQAGDILF
jgi:hypothetical protein